MIEPETFKIWMANFGAIILQFIEGVSPILSFIVLLLSLYYTILKIKQLNHERKNRK